MTRFLITFLMLSFSLAGQAQTPNFTNLSQADFDNVIKEFSSNFSHHSVMGAGTLGTLWGFEFGLVGGLTQSPDSNSIVRRTDSSVDLKNIYHGGLLLGVGAPLGLTAEAVIIPKMTISGGDAEYTSLGLKWTMTDEVLKVIPFNLAVRGTYTTSKFSFKQVISGYDATVQNENKVTGVQLLASPRLPLFEPYAGIGYLQADDTLSVTGTTGTIFASTFTAAQSASSKPYSAQYLVGVNFRALVSLGLEYQSSFGTSGYTAKLGFSF